MARVRLAGARLTWTSGSLAGLAERAVCEAKPKRLAPRHGDMGKWRRWPERATPAPQGYESSRAATATISLSQGGPVKGARTPLDFPSLAGSVARALLGDPNPRMSTTRELRYGRKGSLQVTIAGEWAGRWRDFESDERGGVLDLVARVRGGDRAAAARWLESCGFGVRARESVSAPFSGARPCGGDGEGRSAAYRQSSQASRRDSARRLWDSTRPIAGTIAAAYLDARGVGPVAGARSLRFHPGIAHPNAPGRFPTLVAGVQDADGEFLGVQRTYLDGPRKADLDPVRASLGSIAGGAVQLAPVLDDAVLVGRRHREHGRRGCGCSTGRAAHGQRSGLRDCAPSCSPWPCAAWLLRPIGTRADCARRRHWPNGSKPKGAG